MSNLLRRRKDLDLNMFVFSFHSQPQVFSLGQGRLSINGESQLTIYLLPFCEENACDVWNLQM